jgi:hypothetical protein
VLILGPMEQTTFINTKPRREGTKKLMQVFFKMYMFIVWGCMQQKGLL